VVSKDKSELDMSKLVFISLCGE